jgi:biopolymer transport protein ExbD
VAFKPQASDSNEGGGEILAEINITPLTDIFLVLLIIFMVTSSVMTNQGVEVKLPGASTASAQTQPDGVIVTLLPDGAMRVNQEIVASGDYAGLESKLRVLFVRAKSRLVILEGDRKAFLGNAIEVMDHARKAGAESFAVATAPAKD